MLIYLRRELFEKHQNLQIELSTSNKEKLAQKLTEEEAKTKTSFKVYVMRKDDDIDFFSLKLDLVELKLLKAGLFEEELAKY